MNTLPVFFLVHNRYRSMRLINQGGFGAVYEALDQTLNRRVALKQLLLTGENLSRQFKHEAQLLANLDHPALPRVTDHFTDPAGQFLVMDYIQGQDLAEQIQQRGAPFPVDQVLEWGFQLLDALHYLHTHEPTIIHRDIKPPNVKLGTDGRVKLLDFGLAKGYAGDSLQINPQPSLMAYTNGFAAPEQILQTGTDARTDLYALGATLYFLMTNTPPADAQLRSDMIRRNQPDPLRPPNKLSQHVSNALGHVLVQSLALDPAARPYSAQEMSERLQKASKVSRTGGYRPISIPGKPERVTPSPVIPHGHMGTYIDSPLAGSGGKPPGKNPLSPRGIFGGKSNAARHQSAKAFNIPKQPRKSLWLFGSGIILVAIAAILLVLMWASGNHETVTCLLCPSPTPASGPTATLISPTTTVAASMMGGMTLTKPGVDYEVKAFPVELVWSDPNGKLGEGESYQVILTASDKSQIEIPSKECTIKYECSLQLSPSHLKGMSGRFQWQVVRVRQNGPSTDKPDEISYRSGSYTLIVGDINP